MPLAHGVCDADDLLVSLARAVDHLGHTLPHAAVVIHLGKAEILKRLHFQLEHRVRRGCFPHAHLLQQM